MYLINKIWDKLLIKMDETRNKRKQATIQNNFTLGMCLTNEYDELVTILLMLSKYD